MLAVANHRAPVPHGGVNATRTDKAINISINRHLAREGEKIKEAERAKHLSLATQDTVYRERMVAIRMVNRLQAKGLPVHPIQLNYQYWQGVRCGWDFCGPLFAMDAKGKPCDPFQGECWLWWRGMHYSPRKAFVKKNGMHRIMLGTVAAMKHTDEE